MATERPRTEGGRLVEAWLAAHGKLEIDFLRQLNERVKERGERPISRVTFWKWKVGDAEPSRLHAHLLEDICGISGRVWDRPVTTQAAS